jgi:DNA-directed RNA polymerase specialized sigma24 family protein
MTPDDFEELLLWLDPDPDATGIPDRDRGAEKYEEIRCRIIKIMRNRGCHLAEEVADETISRVCKRVKKLKATYEGNPALYFYGVAKRVYLEFTGDGTIVMPPPLPKDDPEEVERRHACLDQCLQKLKPEKRELILRFYEGEKRAKIENRQRLAALLGIDSKALSLRTLRIRRELLTCMRACLKEKGPEK